MSPVEIYSFTSSWYLRCQGKQSLRNTALCCERRMTSVTTGALPDGAPSADATPCHRLKRIESLLVSFSKRRSATLLVHSANCIPFFCRFWFRALFAFAWTRFMPRCDRSSLLCRAPTAFATLETQRGRKLFFLLPGLWIWVTFSVSIVTLKSHSSN